MSILEAIHARPSVRASLSGRGKLIFTRGTKNQVCRRQRDDCADASDKMYVADLLETEIFLGRLESISGATKRRNRRVSAYNQQAIVLGLPLKKKQKRSTLLVDLAIHELSRPLRIERPLDYRRPNPRTVVSYTNPELGT